MNALIDGALLRALREGKGWDKQTLAQRADVSPSVVTRLERGSQADLRVSVLLALAQALEVEPASLLTTSHPAHGSVVAELRAAFHEASLLDQDHQRHLAGVMLTYIRELPSRRK